MRDFRRLRAWQAAQEFVGDVYVATAAFPAEERYGLTSQMRRPAVSIASNIAEGCGRDTDADLARFLSIATGSASERESQIETAITLGYLSGESARTLAKAAQQLRRQIHTFRLAVRSD